MESGISNLSLIHILNGKTAALVDSEETADKILEKVKLYYCTVDNEGNKVVDGVRVDENSIAADSSSVMSTESDLSADQNKVNALHSIIDAASASSDTLHANSAAVPASVQQDESNADRQAADEQAQGKMCIRDRY